MQPNTNVLLLVLYEKEIEGCCILRPTFEQFLAFEQKHPKIHNALKQTRIRVLTTT